MYTRGVDLPQSDLKEELLNQTTQIYDGLHSLREAIAQTNVYSPQVKVVLLSAEALTQLNGKDNDLTSVQSHHAEMFKAYPEWTYVGTLDHAVLLTDYKLPDGQKIQAPYSFSIGIYDGQQHKINIGATNI